MKEDTPIVFLTDEAILKEPRMTQSIIQKWIARMIDAGWQLTSHSKFMLVHADEPVNITYEGAYELVVSYRYTLRIPTPYDVAEVMILPRVKVNQEAMPST